MCKHVGVATSMLETAWNWAWRCDQGRKPRPVTVSTGRLAGKIGELAFASLCGLKPQLKVYARIERYKEIDFLLTNGETIEIKTSMSYASLDEVELRVPRYMFERAPRTFYVLALLPTPYRRDSLVPHKSDFVRKNVRFLGYATTTDILRFQRQDQTRRVSGSDLIWAHPNQLRPIEELLTKIRMIQSMHAKHRHASN